MGVSGSKLTPEAVEALQEATQYDRKEIQAWHRSFIKECPRGRVTKLDFRSLYSQFFPFGSASDFADLVFRLFDSDETGDISFGEYLIALSVASRGRLEDKIKCSILSCDQ